MRAKVHGRIRCAIRRLRLEDQLPAPKVIIGAPDVVGKVMLMLMLMLMVLVMVMAMVTVTVIAIRIFRS